MINDADAFLRNILLTVKTIAMVGASDKEARPSYAVFSYLLARGYQVIGVNPSLVGRVFTARHSSRHWRIFPSRSIWWIFSATPKWPEESSMKRLRSIRDRR